jgi:hypothetical protein
LDDLVLQSWHTEWALAAISFRDIYPPNRLRPVAVGVDSRAESLEIARQVLFVIRHRGPIDSCACPPLLPSERAFERFDIDMVQQGGELGMGGLAGRCVPPCKMGQ